MTTYNVIDTHNDDHVVNSFPTYRRAFNYTKKIEPTPAGKPLRTFYGKTREWRYQISTRTTC